MPPEPLGASAIHSTLLLAQFEHVCVVLKLFAVLVESVTASVYLVPLRTTDAVMLSPAASEDPTTWTALDGYISHQVNWKALPPEHSMSVPSCSTEPLVKPSMPTQNAASDVVPVQLAEGSVQWPVALLNELPVSA